MLVYFVGTLAEKIGIPVTPIYITDVLNLRYNDVRSPSAAREIRSPPMSSSKSSPVRRSAR